MEKNSNKNYYPEIDGLRALAVLGVVFFHFFPYWLSGGYVGVDVFFVISGFLVTGTLVKSIETDSFHLLHFYQKRIRRLFPALLLVLFVTTLIALQVFLYEEMLLFGKHLFSATYFFSNVQYFFESGYFDKTNELKPLLHIWSLSLEEQFYFIWPLILFILFRFDFFNRKNWALKLMLFLSLFSFGLCAYFTFQNEQLAFFNLPFRLWELTLGGLSSVFLQRLSHDQKKSLQRFGSFLSVLGLSFILFSYYFFSKTISFPGYAALAPVLGSVLFLLTVNTNNFGTLVLRNPVFVYIGKISYPFYLWHWPLYSFSYLMLGELSLKNSTVLILGALFLSILTYEFVEKKYSRTVPAIIALFVLNLSLGQFGLFFKEISLVFPNLLIKTDPVVETKKAFSASLITERKSSFCRQNFNEIEMCLLSDESRPPNIVLIGDSHANQWFPAFDYYFKKTYPNLNVLVLAKNGTLPLFNVESLRSPSTNLDKELLYILHQKSIDVVIFGGFWSNYISEVGTYVSGYYYKNKISTGAPHNKQTQKEIFIDNFEKTLQRFQDAKKKMYFIYDTPALNFNFEICLPRPFQTRNVQHLCQYKTSDETSKQFEYRSALSPILQKYKVITLDPVPLLCPKEHCSFLQNKVYMFSDSHHLSILGSQVVLNRLAPQF